MLDKLPHYCPVCAYHNWNLDGLVEMIWEYLNLLRIYTKPKVSRFCHSWVLDCPCVTESFYEGASLTMLTRGA